MFTKPSKVITVDTLIDLKSTARRSPKRRLVAKKPIEESLVKNVSPPDNPAPPILELPVIPKVELDSCYKEPTMSGADITWVGDRL